MTEVFFCNFCDQSVAQAKLDSGDAVRHGGRVVCPTCCDTLLLATRGGTERPRGRGGTLAALIVGLLGWAAAGFVWMQQDALRTQWSQDVAAEAGAREAALEALSGRVDALGREAAGEHEEWRAALEELDGRMAKQGREQREQLAALERAVEPVPGLADVTEGLHERVEILETNQTLVDDSIRDLRSAQQFLRDRMAELDRKVELGSAPAPEDSDFPSDLEALLEDLDDEDELNRVAALEQLSKYDDPRLVSYVEPLLEDPYEMNRFYAAYTLGEWQARESVPALIETLNDEYGFVQKAANDALVAITGEDHGFDHKAGEADRRKAYERWKEWWAAQEGDAEPAGGGD